MKRLLMIAATALSVALTGCATHPQSVVNGSVSPSTQTPANAPTTMQNQALGTMSGNETTPLTSTVSSSYKAAYLEAVNQKAQQSRFVYPQIVGLADAKVQAKLNLVLKNLGTHNGTSVPTDHTLQTAFRLLMKRGAFLEVMVEGYDYATGAAHGMPTRTVVMMNMQDGEIYQIGNLFKNGSSYLARLSEAVKATDTQHILNSFQAFTGVTSKDGFYLTDRGVTVFFSPYEWTPFAAGFPQFTIPFRQLQDIIDTNGSLWQAMHSPAALADANITQTDEAKIQSLGYVPVTDSGAGFAQTLTPDGKTLYVWNARPAKVSDGSVNRLFFFLDSRYLGTDTSRDHAPLYQLLPGTRGQIQAGYTSDNGNFTITYQWDGSKLQMNPAFPADYHNWSSK